MEAKDISTKGHLEQITGICGRYVLETYGSTQLLSDLGLAARLHDIEIERYQRYSAEQTWAVGQGGDGVHEETSAHHGADPPAVFQFRRRSRT